MREVFRYFVISLFRYFVISFIRKYKHTQKPILHYRFGHLYLDFEIYLEFVYCHLGFYFLVLVI